MRFELQPLGYLSSCYKEKFAVPRQPGLVPAAQAQLTLLPPFNQADAVAGLDQFSHLWLTFVFHQNLAQGWKAKVRPPRLGGNQKMGVFASRSSFRPNGLGLSVVRLERIDLSQGVTLHLSDIDLVDGTPIVDIKPYLPWADAHPDASAAWAPEPPKPLRVIWSANALRQLQSLPDAKTYQPLVEQVLAQNPKPAYQKPSRQRQYGMRLGAYDVGFVYRQSEVIEVTDLQAVAAHSKVIPKRRPTSS